MLQTKSVRRPFWSEMWWRIHFGLVREILESIWSGPKCYTSANKSVIVFVKLASFYDFYEFSVHKSNSDHPKINDRMYFYVCFECARPKHPPGKPSNRFYKPWKWSEVTFSTSMQILRNLVENDVFEAILTVHQISSRFNGRFRTKECSKRKVFGDLFGPKCDGEYISDLFETFGVDLEWSEILYQCQEICHISCTLRFILRFLWIHMHKRISDHPKINDKMYT